MSFRDTDSSILKLVYGTFISKILGFLREIIISFYWGATAVSDAFFLALQIPVLFRRILGEEMFEKTIMPTFIKKLSVDRKDAWSFLSTLFWYSILLSLFFVILLYALKNPLISLIAPGITDPGTIELINRMTIYIIPYLILTTIYSFLGTIFNFTRRQFIFSIAPAISNGGIIIFILLFYPYIKEISLPAGFLAGGVLYILFLIPFFLTKKYRRDYLPKLTFSLKHKKSTLQLISFQSFWVFLQALFNKSVDFVDRIIASFLITGSISGLWYAKRLEQLPSSIISMSISRAIHSNLSDHYSGERYREFGDTIAYGIKLCFSVIVPLTILLCVLGKPISVFMFKRGEFTDLAADMTSKAFIAYGIGILAVSLYNLFSRAYSVLINNRFTTTVMFFSSVLNIILSIILASTPLKLAGIALASSVSFYFASSVLFLGLRRELKKIDYEFDIKGLFAFASKLLIPNTAMAFAVHFTYKYAYTGFYRKITILYMDMGLFGIILSAFMAGMAVYIIICNMLGIKIMKSVFNILKRK